MKTVPQTARQQEFVFHLDVQAVSLPEDSARLLKRYAERIPPENIPPNPRNAAKVLVRVINGRSRPLRWMLTKSMRTPPNVIRLVVH